MLIAQLQTFVPVKEELDIEKVFDVPDDVDLDAGALLEVAA